MAGEPSNFVPPPDLDGAFEAWRRIQVRQLFRLALEALLYWTICQLEQGPKSTEALVSAFLAKAGRLKHATAREWLNSTAGAANGPTGLMDQIQQVMDDPSKAELASTIGVPRDYAQVMIWFRKGAEQGLAEL
jgi:hypothetical protein